ncbi:hypothetical protein BT93_L5759 [Corymbia citriodora subsp. variegata]|uniref:Enoyl reductase (ER) domain-containing protein n=1 Tax=Corymbia citriodora subsp. variegata TaxID=360336 RepID=A0A8T0CF03_CORYI|nr:hypothetical protein BT93_L5759 [Corymbia citriodora subsp. variegata]
MIRNHAVAMNPIDVKLQKFEIYPLSYPTVLGEDVAGEVISIGSKVTRFQPGDRVTGMTAGFVTKKTTEMAFQQYVILEENLTSEIPDHITYEQAAVLPLGFTTASAGLFNPDLLSLRLPTEPAHAPTSEIVLVWGGASSVGGTAIQLLIAAGYEVFTTASAKNFDVVKKLGASQVFDYNKSDVVEEVVKALQNKTLTGTFDAIGGAAVWEPCIKIIQQSHGNKTLVTTNRQFTEPPADVTIKFCFAVSIRDNNVGEAVWRDFLPKALVAGTLVPYPEPLIAGEGLDSIQTGIDVLAKGVSAQKVVVKL